MSEKISEEKLKEAKEKLACKIESPEAHAARKAAEAEKVSAGTVSDAQNSSCGISAPQEGAVSADGKVRLTQMTTAGG